MKRLLCLLFGHDRVLVPRPVSGDEELVCLRCRSRILYRLGPRPITEDFKRRMAPAVASVGCPKCFAPAGLHEYGCEDAHWTTTNKGEGRSDG